MVSISSVYTHRSHALNVRIFSLFFGCFIFNHVDFSLTALLFFFFFLYMCVADLYWVGSEFMFLLALVYTQGKRRTRSGKLTKSTGESLLDSFFFPPLLASKLINCGRRPAATSNTINMCVCTPRKTVCAGEGKLAGWQGLGLERERQATLGVYSLCQRLSS